VRRGGGYRNADELTRSCVAPGHPYGSDAHRQGPFDVVHAVADHDDVWTGLEPETQQRLGDDGGLVGPLAVEGRPGAMLEVRGDAEMVADARDERFRLGARNCERGSGEACKQLLDADNELVLEDPDVVEPFPVCGYPSVARHADRLEGVRERRADEAEELGFGQAGMADTLQRVRNATCDPGRRVRERAVEIEEHRAKHGPTVATGFPGPPQIAAGSRRTRGLMRDGWHMTTGEPFTATPQALDRDEWAAAHWSVYLARFNLTQRGQAPALKVGMVGSGTVASRMRSHERQFGPTEVLGAWSLAHATAHLDEVASWRLTEQYEARLQFAAEFAEPTARLRRLRPDTLVYSYEWFEDDQRVINAVGQWALRPVTLPHGWQFAKEDPSAASIREQPRD
jgi:hypothetical protein